MEERVLCFERKWLDDLGSFQGLSLDIERYRPLFTKSNTVYKNRSEAETDFRFKQLIPYVLIFHDGEILRYQRGKGGGEKRLHGLYSIGIGGHIADQDLDLFSKDPIGYHDGMLREVKEEVDVDFSHESMVALINDDNTEVGKVHFGVVHIMHATNKQFVGRRQGILAPEFVPIANAGHNLDQYETWSRFCLEKLDLLLSKADAATGSEGSFNHG